MDQAKGFVKIGDLANKAGVTVRTLRYYEEMGLLSPSEVTTGGFRLYSESDLTRLSFIKRFKDLGLSLEDIRELLLSNHPGDSRVQRIKATHSLLHKQLEQIEAKFAELTAAKANINAALQSLATCSNCKTEPCPSTCANRKSLL